MNNITYHPELTEEISQLGFPDGEKLIWYLYEHKISLFYIKKVCEFTQEEILRSFYFNIKGGSIFEKYMINPVIIFKINSGPYVIYFYTTSSKNDLLRIIRLKAFS